MSSTAQLTSNTADLKYNEPWHDGFNQLSQTSHERCVIAVIRCCGNDADFAASPPPFFGEREKTEFREKQVSSAEPRRTRE